MHFHMQFWCHFECNMRTVYAMLPQISGSDLALLIYAIVDTKSHCEVNVMLVGFAENQTLSCHQGLLSN